MAQLSRGQQRQIRRLSSQNRRAKIRLALMDAGVQTPALDLDANGMVDVLEVGKVVAQLLEALGQDVPDELSDTDPERVAEAILSVLADASGAGSSTNFDPTDIAKAMNESNDPVQMRARRAAQKTQLSKPSIYDLMKKPGSKMTFGERRRVALYKAGFGDPEANQT